MSTYTYVDTNLPACAAHLKMGSPDAYNGSAEHCIRPKANIAH